MSRALLPIRLATVISVAAGARADIMHWYWEVEVNGEAVDAGLPVPVETGDDVRIELWADFDPYREGFAGAEFAVIAGDTFFAHGPVNISSADDFGLNPALNIFGENGILSDADGSGVYDMIDAILAFQFPRQYGDLFDFSDPIRVYSIGWGVEAPVDEDIHLRHGARLDGRFNGFVWEDMLTVEYPITSDPLVIIPAPHAFSVISAGLLVAIPARRRAPSRGN